MEYNVLNFFFIEFLPVKYEDLLGLYYVKKVLNIGQSYVKNMEGLL